MKVSRRGAVINFGWKLAEQVGSQSVSFIVSIILARILLPEDYSIVSIISIITGFCVIIVEAGFATALIQKKDADIYDFSSVLILCIVVSLIIYLILFALADYIASVYEVALISPVIRVYSLIMPISAINNVQSAYISKNLQFRKYFFATIGGTIVSAIVGISMAYSGFGSWALVAQRMTNAVVDGLILFITTDFRPKFFISIYRIQALWGFSSKVLGTTIIDTFYDNVRPLIVGLKFDTKDLAFYEKGRSYPGLVNGMLNTTMSSVLFPVMSKAQDSIDDMKKITRRFIQISSFFLFPSLLGLAAIAPNLIVWMLTDKWRGAVPFMQVFCINYMFRVLQTGNLQALNALGRSDIVFKIDILKKIINFSLLFLLIIISTSPLALAALGILTSLIAFVINSSVNSKYLSYGMIEQIGDVLPNLIPSMFMSIVVCLVGKINLSLFPLLLFQIIIGIFTFFLLSVLLKNSSYLYVISSIRKRHKT